MERSETKEIPDPDTGRTEAHGTGHHVTDGRAPGTVVRRRSTAADDGLPVASEARLLELLATRAPVPVPRVVEVWPDQQAMEMTRIPGVPLLEWLDERPPPPTPLVDDWAARLGELQAALADIPGRLVAGLVPRDATTPAEYLAELEPVATEVTALLRPSERTAVERFLTTPPPPPAPRLWLCHGDLGAEHVFVDPRTGEVTGVIDWSDAAVTDPALDLGLVLRDLGARARDRVLERLGKVDDGVVARSEFYARARALEDLRYGVDQALPVYSRNARRAIETLFEPLTGG